MYFTRLPHTEINLAEVRQAMFSFRFLMLLAWIAFSLLLPPAFCLSIQVPLNTLAILPKGQSNKRNHSTRLWCFPSLLPLATSRPSGTGQGIGNVLCAPCMGLLAYQLQPGMPLPPLPQGLRTSGSIHSPSTIWLKSQTGGKTNQGAWEVRGRFTEAHQGPASHVSSLLSAVWWECYEVKSPPVCWPHAVPLWHHQGYFHPCNGSLLWTTFLLSSRRTVSWSQTPYSNISRLDLFQTSKTGLLFPRIRFASASCMPWESTQPHCNLERHFISQGRAAL